MMEKNIEKLLKDSLSQETDADQTLKNEVLSKMKTTQSKNTIKFKRIIRNTAAIAACFVLCIGVAANVSNVAYNTLKEIPVISTLTNILTFRAYEYDGGKTNAQIDKPVVPEYEKVNMEIDDYVEKIIADYNENAKLMTGESLGETDKYELTTDYAVLGDNEEYLSLRIRTSVVMAGTSVEHKYFVVDKKSGDTINLGDLLTAEQTAQIAEAIKAKMTEFADIYTTTNSTIDNKAFYVDTDGKIYVCFERGTVAAKAFGEQKFIVGTIKNGEAKLFAEAINVRKVEGTITEASEFDLFTIEDYNGNKHEISSLGAIIMGEKIEVGNYATIEYTGITKNVVNADIIETFKI